MDKNFEKSFKVTVIRDPIERYLSFLRAKKRSDPSYQSLEDVLSLRSQAPNHFSMGLDDNALCHYLCDDPRLQGRALLENAKKNLLSLDCVILFENFTHDVLELFDRLGIEIDSEEIPLLNCTKKEAVSDSLLEKVEKANKLDKELYEFARTNLVKKNSQAILRGKGYRKLTQVNEEIRFTFDQPLWGKGWGYREKNPHENSYFRQITKEPATICFSLQQNEDYYLDFWTNADPVANTIEVEIDGQKVDLEKTSEGRCDHYHANFINKTIESEPTKITFYPPKSAEGTFGCMSVHKIYLLKKSSVK